MRWCALCVDHATPDLPQTTGPTGVLPAPGSLNGLRLHCVPQHGQATITENGAEPRRKAKSWGA
jgi:hypothetical protein